MTPKLFPEPRQPKPERKRWPMWDALAACFPAPLTKSEKADFARTCRELDQVQADPGLVRGAVAAWKRKYPRCPMTHRVLRMHWAELVADVKPQPIGGKGSTLTETDVLTAKAIQDYYRTQKRRVNPPPEKVA